jgi:hypothetical protein
MGDDRACFVILGDNDDTTFALIIVIITKKFFTTHSRFSLYNHKFYAPI